MSNSVSLPTLYQQFVHLSRYARYLDDKGRRETWQETVDRYVDFMIDHLGKNHNYKPDIGLENEIRSAILNQEVMPSMRALMTAGPALARENVAGFNCSYVAIDHVRAFDEILYILMCGTGVGFSVERQEICRLPAVPDGLERSGETIVVADSKRGWAVAFRKLLAGLYSGWIHDVDYSRVRPAGARLKTFGGRASGPDPLRKLMEYTVSLFKSAQGRQLESIECHDLVCMIADVVVVGGVRRCLPGNTPVMTPGGAVPISDIKPGDTVVVAGRTAAVTAHEATGKKSLLRIKHDFGVLECTPEHEVAVFNSMTQYEFKPASELTIGDRLVWDRVGYDGAATQAPPVENSGHFNASRVLQPCLDVDLAWLIGLFQADGYVGKRSIEVSGNSREKALLHRAAEIIYRQFGVESSVGPDGRSGVGYRLRANSTTLANWFLAHVKRPNTPLHIPDFIMNAPRHIRASFLAGLYDGDGRHNKKDNRVDQCATIYGGYASQVVTCLASLGVAAPVSFTSAQKRRDRGEDCQDHYTVRISGVTNRRAWQSLVGELCDKTEFEEIESTNAKDFSFPVSWAGQPNSTRRLNTSTIRYDFDLVPTSVVSIEKAGEAETYDIEVADLHCFSANGLVVHNSALISLSNLSDMRMRDAKAGTWWASHGHRALANNSVAYTEKPEVGHFMGEWLALYNSKSGERGVFNRAAARAKCDEIGRPSDRNFGTNPCVPGDTPILTSEGYVNIGRVVGEDITVWNGDQWTQVRPFSTGYNDTLRVTLDDGTELTCTDYHKWLVWRGWARGGSEHRVMARDLAPGDKLSKYGMPVVGCNNPADTDVTAYSQGFYSADGNKDRNFSWVYGPKAAVMDKLEGSFSEKDEENDRWRWTHGYFRKGKSWVPHERNLLYRREWLAGLLDGDGTVVRHPQSDSLQLSSVDLDFLKGVRLMLTTMGVQAKIGLMKSSGKKAMPGGVYGTQDCWRLCINAEDTQRLLGLGLDCKRLEIRRGEAQRDARRFVRVVSVERAERQETYCFHDPVAQRGTFNGIVTAQCGEIILRSQGFCNLTEVVARADDTVSDLHRKVQLATILGTWQSTLTDFKYIRPKWKQNAEEERLLGVSITGIMDCPLLQPSADKLPELLASLREFARDENVIEASQIGINPSAAITCVKPSGCRPEGELVTTDQGIFTLGDLLEDHPAGEEWHPVTGRSHRDYGAVTQSYDNGVAEVFCVQTGYGVQLKSTANHQWRVEGRFVRTDELRPGDRIDVEVGAYTATHEATLDGFIPVVSFRNDATAIKVPSHMDPSLAWVLGYLWGDGSQSAQRWRHRWVDAREENLQKLQAIMEDKFGLRAEYEKFTDRAAYQICYASKAFWIWMERNGFMKYGQFGDSLNNIPLKVRTSSAESIRAFLAGWADADGCVSRTKQGSKYTFTSADERFMRHAQHVALCAGLVIGVSINSRRRALSQRPMFLGSLSKAGCPIAFASFARHSTKAVGVVDFVYYKPCRETDRHPALGEVVSVTPCGTMPTFDVETEQHWFWAGGFASHNTVSQLVDAASGIHRRHSAHYIRRVRNDTKDPLTGFMAAHGVPAEPDVMNDSNVVFSFPQSAPEGSDMKDYTAIEQLEFWLQYRRHWCDHNPSTTVYVDEVEWPEVGGWVYRHFDEIGGLSFLPKDGGTYQQMPYEEVDADTLAPMVEAMPEEIDWTELREGDDLTVGSQELACQGGACEWNGSAT